MSDFDVKVETSPEVETPKQHTIEDFLHWWHSDNGAPIVVGNIANVCKHIEAMGYQIYYVVSMEKYYAPVSAGSQTLSTVASYRPQVFKVVNSLIGRSVAPTDEVPLDEIETEAKFALPPIPYEMIDKMDKFFRSIDKKQGTESILLLTYDTTFTDSNGWGILVPVQANTSTFCDYDPASVVDEQGPTVQIVGSAHSHPDMPAYASGTDHKDQADFDGLHITYGWQKSVQNGATQYHIELQMGGKAFLLKPETVFCSMPVIEHDDEELEAWTSKVTKKTTTTHIVSSGTHSSSTGISSSGYRGGVTHVSKPIELSRVKNLPSSAPKVEDNKIIGMLNVGETLCPFCDAKLIPPDLKNRRCLACHQYIALHEESVADIVNVRTQAKVYTHDIDVENGAVTQPIYYWRRSGGQNTFELVFDPNPGKA